MKDRKLVIDQKEADTVRWIFRRFVQLGSATALAEELVAKGLRNRYGHKLDKGALYKLLNNRVYIGEAVHKGMSYPGEHEPIIDRKLWDKLHAILKESPRKRGAATKAQTPALLKGLIFDEYGRAMSPTHTRKRGRLYRYYVSQTAIKQGSEGQADHIRVPAGEVERIVIDQIRRLLVSPEVVVATWKAVRQSTAITESEVREGLLAFQPLWDELFPAEQARIVQLLVERVQLLPQTPANHPDFNARAGLCVEPRFTGPPTGIRQHIGAGVVRLLDRFSDEVLDLLRRELVAKLRPVAYSRFTSCSRASASKCHIEKHEK